MAPEASCLSHFILLLVRGLPQVQEPLLSFSSPNPGAQILCHSLSSFFSLLLLWVPSVYAGIFPVLPSAQGPRLMFSWSSVRIVPFVDVFLMRLWGEMNSTSSCASAILTPFWRFRKSEPEESFQNLGTVNKFFGEDWGHRASVLKTENLRKLIAIVQQIIFFFFSFFSLNLYFLRSLIFWQQNWETCADIFPKLPTPIYT